MKLQLTRRFDPTQPINLFAIAAVVVVFALFIIYFAVMPFHREWGPARPFVATADPLPATERDLNIYVLADGRLLVGPVYVSEAELEKTLREINDRTPARPLVLKADKSVPYSKIEVVFRAARDSGFADIRLITGPRDNLEALQRQDEQP